ncbi:receptor-type tyrosine-protein phosphatase N2 [Solea senegalensis]|uniref:Receptor-type tyrosine-protein phosphatase N2 n=1 Tax=Solea senegalensis TaxID=28829 RepID=A0AAV6TA60_SOLSE|nr:receptor-type tyrosine-protein phosphatase N2 isoform X1 [Solea senegalensis]KAG7526319.1 receptor-type tyrosine-protein phosphatase N2 [Solea senegalensis]
MDSRRCPILFAALALSLCSSPALSDRKFGCLFEDELCTPYEFCVNDELFGRCQELVGAQLYTYDISPSALQRLRILLQKLAHRGLTWRDDITQQVISRELSKLRNVPLRHQTPPPSLSDHLTAYSGSRDRKLRPAQVELNRNLQQYLKGLGFLPQVKTDGQREGAKVQNEDIESDGRSEPSWPKPKQGWKETTVYSLHKGDGKPPVTKVFSQSGEGRHPKLSTTYSSQDPARSKLLSSHLERLLAGAPSVQQDSAASEASWPKGKLHYLGYIHPAPSEHAKLQSQEAFGSKTQRPNLDRLLFKAGSNQLPAKEPLSVMDERFIQNVVNRLGSHSIDMEALMGKDLDQLAEVITGALQEVDEKEQPATGVQPGRGTADSMGDMDASKKPLAATLMNQDQQLKSALDQDPNQKDTLRMKQGQQKDSADKEPVDKQHAAFFSKLLDYLNLEAFDDMDVGVGPPAPLQKTVGMESVQSRTSQTQVPVPHRGEEKTIVVPAKEGSALRLTGSPAGPDTQVDSKIERLMQGIQAATGKKQLEEPEKKDMKIKTQLVHVGVKEFSSRGKDRHFGYIITGSDSLTTDQGSDLMERLTQRLNLHVADLTQLSVLGPALTFRVGANSKNVSTADLVQVAVQQKQQLEKETGLKIVEAGVSDRGSLTQIPVVKETRVESGQFLLLSVLCMLFILVALAVSATFFCVRQRSHLHMKEKLASLGTDTSTDATATYQELCRQRMAIRTSERVERPETLRHSRLNSVSSQFSDGPAASPSTRSSTSSWCEEPVPSNMDISTGHMILSYMEDHLKNKNRLEREWEALCSYQAEPSACSVGHGEQNSKRNRSDAVVVYDHSRITLKAENNHGNSDYINASPIMDHDPRNPTYISSQGPLPSTVADFWQMVWESGCVVIVMLTPLSENGVKQCHHYWPDEGSDVYHIYEVNLVSEHIWCEDFLVRSFYLKNLQTNETRTVTQFHFLSWMDRGIPASARTLLDFRRKVNKCYRGRSCPIIVHCSDGAGRSGTYILIDMVLNRMAKGAKEIDIAATLEHLRDQRAGMVQTKEQFEFALTAVAEEVNAILKALPQ